MSARSAVSAMTGVSAMSAEPGSAHRSAQRRAVGLYVADSTAGIALFPVRRARVRTVCRLVSRLAAVIA